MNKSIFFIIVFSFLAFLLKAQSNFFKKSHIGVNAGVTNYTGSLNQSHFKAGVGLHAEYEITGNIHARINLFITELYASDSTISNFGPDKRENNYYFKSNLNELSLIGQYDIFDLNKGKKITPYVFAGIALYDYKPYQEVGYYNESNQLRYANLAMSQSEKFSNQQIAFPVGIGIKYAFSSNMRIFAEGNYRITTNQFLDNYHLDNKADSYYSAHLGLLFRLSKIGNARKGITGKDCDCPVY